MATESLDTPRSSKDVMLDIETLSTRNDALVLSIGAVRFDCIGKDGPWLADERFFATPDLTEQLLMGRAVDQPTQKWWAKQPPEAQAHWINPMLVQPVYDVLGQNRTLSHGLAPQSEPIAHHPIGDCLIQIDRLWETGYDKR